MTGIQLIAILAAVLMVYISYTSFRRRELRASEFVLWMAIWIALAAVSVFPSLLRGVIAPLAVARLLDLVVIGGILTLGIIVFSLNRSLRRLDNRLESLVQHLALQSAREEVREGQRGREERVGDPAQALSDRVGAEDLPVGQSGRHQP
jgi:hypothetical protein